jgi:hypothetical protein
MAGDNGHTARDTGHKASMPVFTRMPIVTQARQGSFARMGSARLGRLNCTTSLVGPTNLRILKCAPWAPTPAPPSRAPSTSCRLAMGGRFYSQSDARDAVEEWEVL